MNAGDTFHRLQDHILEKLDTSDDEIDYYIYNLNLDDLDGRNTAWKDYDEQTQQEIIRTMVQVKLLAGEKDLLNPEDLENIVRDEFRTLKAWMNEKEEADELDPLLLEKNLKKYLQSMRPTAAAGYSRSEMAQVFREIKDHI